MRISLESNAIALNLVISDSLMRNLRRANQTRTMLFQDVSVHPAPAPMVGSTQRVLITGAASGIGLAFAEALSRRHDGLLMVDCDGQSLDRIRRQLDGEHDAASLDTIVTDLREPEAGQTLLNICKRQGWDVSVLINCAGIGNRHRFVDQQPESIRSTIDVNVGAVVELTRAFLPAMIKRGHGAVINVCSMAAFQPMPEMAVYGATKAFIQSFTESLQREVEGTGVYVASLCPGMTRTPFLQAAGFQPSDVPAHAQTAEQVVAEALRGIEKRQPLIVTGFANRARVHAQRASLRSLLKGVHHCLRYMHMMS
jgi:short-subunit dehydrogenase